MGKALTEAGRVYEQLWVKTSALLRSGQLQIDPLLRNHAADPRRCVTLVARPDTEVQRKVETFLQEAAAICPNQHFYQAPELHMTVMAIISGSEFWRDEMRRLPACRAILKELLRNCQPFRIRFHGVTVSPDAVMIQGFPVGDTLARLRDEIRTAFAKHGLGGKLDRRYKTTTAHLTVMRFAESGAEWRRLYNFLQTHRETDFGETRIRSLQLIWGDWYASAGVVRVLHEYPLCS